MAGIYLLAFLGMSSVFAVMTFSLINIQMPARLGAALGAALLGALIAWGVVGLGRYSLPWVFATGTLFMICIAIWRFKLDRQRRLSADGQVGQGDDAVKARSRRQ